MLALRCTKRLLARLPPSSDNSSPEAPGALGHWYANLLQIQGKPHVLALSERSLLCVVLPAAPYADLLARFPLALEDLLRHLSFPQTLISAELRHYGQICVAPTVSKTAIALLNQYMLGLKADIRWNPRNTLRQREMWLSQYISKVLAFRAPREVALEMLANERA